MNGKWCTPSLYLNNQIQKKYSCPTHLNKIDLSENFKTEREGIYAFHLTQNMKLKKICKCSPSKWNKPYHIQSISRVRMHIQSISREDSVAKTISNEDSYMYICVQFWFAIDQWAWSSCWPTRAQYSDPDKVFSYQDECQKFEFDPMVGEHEYLCSAVDRRLQQYKYYFNIGW